VSGQVSALKTDIRKLENMDHILERHITNKFEETNQRQAAINKQIALDFETLKNGIK